MLKLLFLLCGCTLLARCSEQYSRYCEKSGNRYRLRYDIGYWCLLAVLVLFSGLRIQYNDTSRSAFSTVACPEAVRKPVC